MTWQQRFVSALDRTAALMTLVTLFLDMRWGCGLTDRRWAEREAEHAAILNTFDSWGP